MTITAHADALAEGTETAVFQVGETTESATISDSYATPPTPPTGGGPPTGGYPTNRPPVVSDGSKTVAEDAIAGTDTVTGSYSDPDGDPVNCYATGLLQGESFAAQNGTWTWTFSRADGPRTRGITINAYSAGGTATATATATVVNVAPDLRLVEVAAIDEGGTATLAGTFTDPGADTFTLTVDWGDGVTESVYLGSQRSFSRTHVYLDDDPSDTPSNLYLIEATVGDHDGGEDTRFMNVRVNNVVPTVLTAFATTPIVEGDRAIVEAGPRGTPFTAGGTFADPGTRDTFAASVVSYGDGAVAPLTRTDPRGFDVPGHVYPQPDDSNASVTVKDDDTGVSATTQASQVPVTAVLVGDLTATDDADAANFAIATDAVGEPPMLYLFADDGGRAIVRLDLAAQPAPVRPEVRRHLLWSISGPSGTPAGAGNFAGGEQTVTLALPADGDEHRVFLVQAGFDDDGNGTLGSPEVSRKLNVTALRGRIILDKMDLAGSTGVLTEAEEDGAGAFVPVNNDDDDYSIEGNNLGSDLEQNVDVTGEDDLLPITLRGSRVGKQYKLVVPAGLRVYDDAPEPRRREPAELTFGMPADGLRLWVEGRALGAHSLSLQLLVGDAVIQGDKAKVTAFRWFGPLNVPEHAIYRYTTTGALPEGAGWVDPQGGDLWTTSVEGPTDVTIKWGAGPAVGKAVFQADANYTWGLGVNVVEVRVEAPDAGNAFTPGQPFDDGGQNGIVLKSGNPGLAWGAKVTARGPLGDRGVAQMDIGFVQNVEVATLNTAYLGPAGDPPRQRKVSFEGQTLIDQVAGATAPFYSSLAEARFSPQAATPLDPSANVKTITSRDTPEISPPVRWRAALADSGLKLLNLLYKFALHVVARTLDTRHDADEWYSSQAVGNWSWNATGSIGPADSYAWTPDAAAGLTPPAAWTPSQPGTQPEKLAGTPANVKIAGDPWPDV